MFYVFHRFAYMKKQNLSEFGMYLLPDVIIDMRRLTTVVRSDFVVVRT
jgi:hypothetical protein